jgi:hypothetical protein
MFDYSRRLGMISTHELNGVSLVEVIAEQARAYLASLNAMSLVSPDSQWIIYKGEGSEVIFGKKPVSLICFFCNHFKFKLMTYSLARSARL